MSSAALHQFGRDALVDAWPVVTGRQASLAELQIAGAVAAFESGYGTATFRNQGTPVTGTNNWGAVQCPHGPPCGDACFEATDTSPRKITPENPRGEYQACFARFATPAEGAAHFVKQITLRRPESWAAMQEGDIDAFSAAMHASGYYEGFGPTVDARIANHAKAVEQRVNEIASALGEEVAATRGGAPGSGGLTTLAACAGAGVLLYYVVRLLKG